MDLQGRARPTRDAGREDGRGGGGARPVRPAPSSSRRGRSVAEGTPGRMDTIRNLPGAPSKRLARCRAPPLGDVRRGFARRLSRHGGSRGLAQQRRARFREGLPARRREAGAILCHGEFSTLRAENVREGGASSRSREGPQHADSRGSSVDGVRAEARIPHCRRKVPWTEIRLPGRTRRSRPALPPEPACGVGARRASKRFRRRRCRRRGWTPKQPCFLPERSARRIPNWRAGGGSPRGRRVERAGASAPGPTEGHGVGQDWEGRRGSMRSRSGLGCGRTRTVEQQTTD